MSDLRLNGGTLNPDNVLMTTEPQTLDIEIEPAIVINDNRYSTLHLEEPSAKAVEIAERELANGMHPSAVRKYQIALVAGAAKVNVAIVERMRISQVREGSDFLARFLSGGPSIIES
jgi:hypothetical protein